MVSNYKKNYIGGNKMFSKKKLATGLTLSSMLLLAACGNDAPAKDDADKEATGDDTEEVVNVTTEGFPIVEETIKMTLMAPGTGMAEWKDMPTLIEYAEMTNIELDYMTPPLDDFATRFNLTLAGGDLPDILFAPGGALTPADEVSYGEQGLLIPLNDLIDNYAPNLKAVLDEMPEVREGITTPDGNIYALPSIGRGENSPWPTGPLWFNGAFMDELDEEVPETLDEFYDLLVRFRDDDPNNTGADDTIPFSNGGLEHPRPWLLSAFGLHDWGVQELDGEAIYSPMTDNGREYLKFMRKLFDEGLMDEEIFSQSDGMKKAKVESNEVGIFQDWFPFFSTGETEEESMNNPMFKPLTSEFNSERTVAIGDNYGKGTFAITSANEHPEATMRWVDWLYTQEGWHFFNSGPAGTTWDWDEDTPEEWTDYKYVPNEYWAEYPEEQPYIRSTEKAIEEGEEYRGTVSPFYAMEHPGAPQDYPRSARDPYNPFSDWTKAETAEKIDPYGKVPMPQVYLTNDEIDETRGITGDLETFIEEEEARFITGQIDPNDDADWDKYVSTLKNMGVERLLEIYNEALNR